MCGPSKAAVEINNNIQAMSAQVTAEGNQIFGDTNTAFNQISGQLGGIVNAGPGQAGWGAAESNAVNAQIMDQAAASARNEKSAVGNSVAAIGGGNTVNPSGLETAVNLQAANNVEATKSNQLQSATEANFEQGNQNFFKAASGLESAPNMFNASISANKNTMAADQQAQQSQSQMDAAKGWWKPIAAGVIGAGLNVLAPGAGTMVTKGLDAGISANEGGGAGAATAGGGGGGNSGGGGSQPNIMGGLLGKWINGRNGGESYDDNDPNWSGGNQSDIMTVGGDSSDGGGENDLTGAGF
jgi:hypothetical protein